jgi:hypothetical protein
MSELIVASVTGCHSVCPYDYYAQRNAKFFGDILTAAGVEHKIAMKNNDFKPACGSGPGGRIRFGDGMAPPTVNFLVAEKDAAAARNAFEKRGYAHLLTAVPIQDLVDLEASLQSGGMLKPENAR